MACRTGHWIFVLRGELTVILDKLGLLVNIYGMYWLGTLHCCYRRATAFLYRMLPSPQKWLMLFDSSHFAMTFDRHLCNIMNVFIFVMIITNQKSNNLKV